MSEYAIVADLVTKIDALRAEVARLTKALDRISVAIGCQHLGAPSLDDECPVCVASAALAPPEEQTN